MVADMTKNAGIFLQNCILTILRLWRYNTCNAGKKQKIAISPDSTERKCSEMAMNNHEHDMHSLTAASEMFFVMLVRFFAGLFSFAKFYFYYFRSFKQVLA